MSLSQEISNDRRSLAHALKERIDELIKIWEDLGVAGPGRELAGTAEMARSRYFLPLAKALIGALNGSSKHAALYFDERMRYIDKGDESTDFRALLNDNLSLEFKKIEKLVEDILPQATVETELREFHAPLCSPPKPVNKVLFIGDCLFVETRAFLSQRMMELKRPADIRQVFFSTNQPIPSVDSAITNEVRRYQPDLIGISLFTFEGVPPYTYAMQRAGTPFKGRQPRVVDGLVALAHHTIDDIRKVSDATIAMHIPCGAPLSRVRRQVPIIPAHSRGQRNLLSDLAEGLHELIASSENVLAVEEEVLVDGVGGVRIAASPAFAEDDVPAGYAHTTTLGPTLASYYSDLLSDHGLLSKAKVLLVDFDNTLWQGIMAEGEVTHEKTRQELLLELKNSGVLLVALSKNNESSIRWDEMRLAESDFALKKINWQPKPDNVAAAIEELDLSADTFVLLDDNPAERAMVTEMIPGVKALDPTIPETWRALRRWLFFPSTCQTEEARRRTDMYREAAARRSALSEPYDYETMMKSLNLQYSFTRATTTDMPRLMELIGRTNQFNTTTNRRSLAEVGELLSSEKTQVYVASLRDRFGDLGVVAVVIFDQPKRLFDSVIMSCRAMGFGLEFAILQDVMEAAGPGEFRGLFIPTDRNGPAAELFKQAGFHEESNNMWVLPATAARPKVPSWLVRNSK